MRRPLHFDAECTPSTTEVGYDTELGFRAAELTVRLAELTIPLAELTIPLAELTGRVVPCASSHTMTQSLPAAR